MPDVHLDDGRPLTDYCRIKKYMHCKGMVETVQALPGGREIPMLFGEGKLTASCLPKSYLQTTIQLNKALEELL